MNSPDQEQVEARRLHLLTTLDGAISPSRAVLALAEVGINAGDLAVALRANPRTTAGWLDAPRPTIKKVVHRERVRELKEVTRFIVANGTIAFQEADWLRDPNRTVDFVTPLELIADGRWREAGRLYCDDVAVEVPSVFRTDREPQPVRVSGI